MATKLISVKSAVGDFPPSIVRVHLNRVSLIEGIPIRFRCLERGPKLPQVRL